MELVDRGKLNECLKKAADELREAEERLEQARREESKARSRETDALNRRNLALRGFERARLALLTPEAREELKRTPPSMFGR